MYSQFKQKTFTELLSIKLSYETKKRVNTNLIYYMAVDKNQSNHLQARQHLIFLFKIDSDWLTAMCEPSCQTFDVIRYNTTFFIKVVTP